MKHFNFFKKNLFFSHTFTWALLPLHPDPPPSGDKQTNTRPLRGIHGFTRCTQTRHKPTDPGWVRQPSRRKRVLSIGNVHAADLAQTQTEPAVFTASVSVSPYEPGLVDAVAVFFWCCSGVLDPSGSYNLSSSSSGFPRLCLVFDFRLREPSPLWMKSYLGRWA